MSVQPNSILGLDLTTQTGRQALQDVIDQLAGTITKQLTGGSPANPSIIDTLRVKKLYVHDGIDVLPTDRPPAEGLATLVTPFLISRRGRPQTLRYEDQGDGGDLLEWRWQPYPLTTATADTGDWELAAYSAQRDPDGAFRRIGSIRFGHDGRIRTYTASEVLVFDSATPASQLPSRHVSGLVIRYASTSTITVSAGKARDKADAEGMELAAEVTVSTSSVGALGVERKALTGTFTFTNVSSSVDVSGGSLLTDFGTRALTGITLSSAASTFTASASILGLIAVGDLVGHSSKGFWRVENITSSTTFTTYTTPGSAFSGEAASVIEYPLIESNAGKVYALRQIAASTGAAAITLQGSASGTESGVAAYATSKTTNPLDATDGWRAVWLVSGASGTTVLLSTQRTSPYGLSGYNTSWRRIGWVRINSSGNVNAIDTVEAWGARRTFAWRQSPAGVVSNASSTNTPAVFENNTAAPPTANVLVCLLASVDPNTVGTVRLQCAGTGNAGGITQAASAMFIQATAPSTSTRSNVVGLVACNGAQQLEHWGAGFSSGDGTYVLIEAWQEDLE